MGVYTHGVTGAFSESAINANLDMVIECPEHLTIEEAASNIIIESEENWNTLMRKVAITELSCLEETGEELIYEASTAGGFLSKVKQFFINLLAKIKGLFKKFFALISSYTATDKEFISKYRSTLLKINTKDFKYKGYKFTNMSSLGNNITTAKKDMDAEVDKKFLTSSLISTELKKFENTDKYGSSTNSIYSGSGDLALDKLIETGEKMEDIVEGLRSTALKALDGGSGAGTSFTSSELNEELFQLFRNGETTKEEIDDIDVTMLLNDIDATKSMRKDANDQYKEMDKQLKNAIKEIDRMEKELTKKLPDKDKIENDATKTALGKFIRAVNYKTTVMRHEQTILQTINAAQLKALKDRNRQAKSVCVSLINYKPKNEGFYYNDDYGYSSYSESGSRLFDDVEFK